ncbi:hypothetical protein C8F01DRAFT_1141262 [Mycena amicta]|nr:hypothetical protein C8F01DRAFT_1141262 [Mycena amicta]
MARTKSSSPKTPKASYAERVLGSFSQIQREHKRHSIHIATLRAQVQKNATARQDKLGPHWKNFVGKAIHKLQDSGFFEASEPAGSVALTPEGKKAIQTARRALDLPSNSEDVTPEDESLLWKEVVYPGSVVGTSSAAPPTPAATPSPLKRRTRHSLAAARDDDEFRELQPRTRKRARTSMAASSISTAPRKPRKPAQLGYNKFTKAQLIQQISTLHAAREADRLSGKRAESPLTELGDDDDLDDRSSLDFGPTRMNDDDVPPPPVRHNPSQVIRTQSGSLINLLSKRPTPAPTEIDSNEQMDMPPDEQMEPPILHQVPTTILTPESTPSPTFARPRPQFQLPSATEQELTKLRAEHATLQTTLATRTAELEEQTNALWMREGEFTKELASVNEALAARARELEQSEASGEQLRVAENALREEVAGMQTMLSAVEMERTGLDAELQQATSQVVELTARVAALELRIGELEGDNARLVHENALVVTERDEVALGLAEAESTIATLQLQETDVRKQLTTAQDELVEMRTAVEQKLRPQLAALDAELMKRIDAEKVAAAKLVEAGREARELGLRLELGEKELKKAKEDGEQAKAALGVSEREREELRGEVTTAQEEFVERMKEAEDLRAQLQADLERVQTKEVQLGVELEQERGKRVDVERELVALNDTVKAEKETMERMKRAWTEFSEVMEEQVASVNEVMA